MTVVEGPPATYTLRGEQFSISAPSWQCPDTGERYTTPDQDVEFITRLHRAWRERHGISQEVLTQCRKALGLSRTEAAARFGMRPGRYRRYEKTGRLPSKADAELLGQLVTAARLAALPMPTTTHLMQPASDSEAEATVLLDNLGELLRRAPGHLLSLPNRSVARITVLSVAGLDSFSPQLLVSKAGLQSRPQPVAVYA